MEVKYTDVDYTVFTGAANHVTQGSSPYLEPTYKYTPLLAFLLTPNIWLHILFGKILFCICDIAVIFVMESLLKKTHPTRGETYAAKLVTAFWVLNPFTMTISSRGNAESIQILLVLLTILFVVERKILWAGVFFGLSVHFKLYPVIYALPFLLFIGSQVESETVAPSPKPWLERVTLLAKKLFSLDGILFGVVSLVTFTLLGAAMFSLYGFDFIENTYLFHFRRKDEQHNFSPYFYILRMAKDTQWLSVLKTVAFLPQLFAVAWCGLRYYDKLPLACFLQTLAFVSLNKVCTSQYFIWYIGLFPLALPFMVIPLRKGCAMVSAWLFGQGVWLYLAYLLEFRKQDVALYVWFASLFFLGVNLSLIYRFVGSVSDDTDTEKKEQ